MSILSPITNLNNVVLEKEISSSLIIELYKKNLNIDVGRFFKDISNVGVYRCLDTGYRFYYPFTLSGDDHFYQELEKFPWYYSPWKWEHTIADSFIQKGDKILEIGCARGSFIKKMEEKGVIAQGLEMNSGALQQCQKIGLQVYPDSIELFSESSTSDYDVVCSFQVVEHISAIRSFLEASIKILKPEGLLIISVPNNDSLAFKKDIDLNMPPHHMGLWDMNSFIKLQSYFDIQLVAIYLEPLRQEHIGYADTTVQEEFQKKLKLGTNIFSQLAGKIYKKISHAGTVALAPYVPGHSIVAVFKKNK